MSGFTYLAYPIDQVDSATMGGIYFEINQIINLLRHAGKLATTYSPGDAFTVAGNTKPDGRIPEVNWLAWEKADLVLAFLPNGVASIGVPIEIDRAVQSGKRVVVVIEGSSIMMNYNEPNVRVVTKTPAMRVEEVATRIGTAIDTVNTVSIDQAISPLSFTVDNDGLLPKKGYPGDAGFDLYVHEDVTFASREFRDVPCGVSVELPPGVWGMITGRSSTIRARGLLVTQGIIDTGYRGPLFAGTQNLSDHKATIKAGDRIAQLILFPNIADLFSPMQVAALSESERGVNGFGSSGA